jgi:zinc/manganese transport system ATP-binding protein
VMDRVVYLAAGRAASGPVDAVVTAEVLSELYGHHVDVLHVHGRILVVAGRGDDPHTLPGESRVPGESPGRGEDEPARVW